MTAAPAGGLRGSAGVTAAPAVTPRSELHPLWIALLLFTVFTVSRIHQYYAVVGAMRPALLLFVFVVGFAAIRPRLLTASNLVRQWPGKVVIALGVLSCLSAVFGISLGSSAFFIISDFGKTVIYTCTLILAFRDWQDVSRLAWAYVIASGIIVILSLFVFGISKTQGGLTYDANDIGLVLLVGLPLTILVFQTSGWRGRLLSAATLLGIVVTIAKSTSRGAFVGLLLEGVALLVLLKGVSVAKRAGAVVVIAVALALGARSDYWDEIATLIHPTQDYNWTRKDGRKEIAKRGIGYMLEYPVFGIGAGNFRMAEGTISDKARYAATGQGVSWRAAHNSYVQVGAELGIPGLLLWSGLVFGCIAGGYRLRKRIPERWQRGSPDQRFLCHASTALPIAMLGFAVSSFFVSHAYTDPIYIQAALLSGVYIGVARRLRPIRLRRSAVSAVRQPPGRAAGLPALRPGESLAR